MVVVALVMCATILKLFLETLCYNIKVIFSNPVLAQGLGPQAVSFSCAPGTEE